uniref:Complement C3-like n=1 Tax=Cyprinus carpio TaxID=7962 RepID=A0A8C1WW69_CYPCA
MGRGTDRMGVKLLFLTVVLLSSPLLTLCDPLFVLSAPNLLRVGSSENVFVEAQDYSGAAIEVKIIVKNHPKKDREILSQSVRLTADNNFQIIKDIKIPDDQNYFSDNPLEKQYVYLQAQFPSVTLEKEVMVSFQSGYIFVQTDKPIYTPASTVQYRIFSLTPNLEPLSQSGITVEIMNPQGITVSSEKIFPVKGMKSGKYPIPEIASPGIWKVVTLFSNTPQKKFTADFEVKEYVLPTFEVKLKPSKSFFYVGDPSLTVDIEAKYLFGQKVDGNAFVVFGVMNGEKKISIPTSLQKVQIIRGEGTAELTNGMITKTFPNINQLVGQSIYVSVSVLTESGSEMVEAERRGIQIVTSPYSIHFKKTTQFFKPGMPFDVSVYVTNPDQTPAVNVEVEVVGSQGTVKGQTKHNGIAKVTVNTLGGSSTQEITAKTKDPQLRDNQQAVKKMTAHAYIPKDASKKNYLHIGIDAAELQMGDSMKVFLNTGQSPGVKDQDYTYMILSKGQIVSVDRFKRRGQSLVSLPVPVTKDMVPSFRFVAYYHVGSSEVVSDSVWVDVKDTCMGKLQVKVKDKMNTYDTGDEVKLEITGDPGAKVGLVVVDKAVQVLNKNRLTQTQIWDVIEKHDTGCTAGGGRDRMGVFTDAGLMFQSNTAGGTNIRTMPECPKPSKRRRRAESLLKITSTLAEKYSGELKQCCVDGMRENKLGYTCDRRSRYIADGKECVDAFLHCCNQMKTHKDVKDEVEEMVLARSDDDDDYYTESEEIVSRTQFPESWLWEEIDLCDKCAIPTKEKAIYLKDSITTWQILAISLSPTLGICVAEPEEIVVFKSLFIDLKMPYSAVRGEQLEIRAIIHNYTPKKQKVRVEFMETEDVCSSASKKGKYRTTVSVDKGSSISVSYVIIPMTLGNHMIEVKASAYDSIYTDGVRKPLKVVAEGVLVPLQRQNLELNPAKNGEKPILLKGEIPADRVPDTPANTYISITGEEISQTVEQAISGDFMGRLIVQPSGCGEQNMIGMTLPVIATHYLDNTNQWEAVGIQRRTEALNHIRTGYQRQLTYRKSDGSYAAFTSRPSSTWLTAYVAKVFAIANNLVTIEENVICSALKWLVLHKQLPDGSFKEDSAVISSGMVGDVQGQNADASLTAFVVIAMQEGREICAGSVASLQESIRKAVSFLEGRLPQLTNPYAVAMTSYAMASENKLKNDILMRHSTQQEASRSWTVPGQHHHSLEATAYAVLALVRDRDFDKAGEAVHWLARQQAHYGGYGTTQATIMVFQAVAEYRTQVKDTQNFNLDVELSVAGRSKPVRWTFKRDNAHLIRSDRVEINKDFSVTARGTGKATLSVLTLYYARPAVKKSDCTLFDLTVKMEEDNKSNQEGAIETYKFTMDFYYKSDKKDATMTILDIGIPTGFSVDSRDLQELSTGKERYIQKFEMDKVLSERGSLILYLEKVLHREKERIAFRMHKIQNVGLLQPAAVTIYEYYSPDARCTKFFHPEREDGALYRLCKGDMCQCAEENCSYQKKNHVEDDERFNKACEAGMDYVYKVKVVGMDLKKDSDIYEMKVEQVLKEGTDEDVEGTVRTFLARPSCREHLGLVKGKSYLIMGKSVDLPKLGGSLQYIMGEQTWVEYWPTREESQTREHRDRYIGISDLENSLRKEGCAT